jgi:hypothetical protein
MKYDYYTQTDGFPEAKITLSQALNIAKRFGMKKEEAKELLQDPSEGDIEFKTICNGFERSISIWAEEAMNY